jgi:hypothetical protein
MNQIRNLWDAVEGRSLLLAEAGLFGRGIKLSRKRTSTRSSKAKNRITAGFMTEEAFILAHGVLDSGTPIMDRKK